MALLVGCKSCGHEFENDGWVPGFKCPQCESPETRPKGSVKSEHKEPPQEDGVEMTWTDDGQSLAASGWKNSPMVGGIAIVLILLTWPLLGGRYLKKPAVERIEVVSMCTGCDKKAENFTDELPAKCEKCGKRKSVYRAYECKGKDDQPCGAVFTFVPPPSPEDPMIASGSENLSDDEMDKLHDDYTEKMMEYENLLVEARKCPECGSTNSSVIYTEKQKKRFEEWRKKRKK